MNQFVFHGMWTNNMFFSMLGSGIVMNLEICSLIIFEYLHFFCKDIHMHISRYNVPFSNVYVRKESIPGIQSPSENGSMEPKYFAFWR